MAETYQQKAKRLGFTGPWSTMDLLNEVERLRAERDQLRQQLEADATLIARLMEARNAD